MMTFRRSLLASVLLLISFLPSSAYDADTHFWLTYFLAVKTGYTTEQARRIASLTISVDFDHDTWPVIPRNAHLQRIRTRFHALPSTKEVKRIREDFREGKIPEINGAVMALIDHEDALRWQEAVALRNPGIYLHYFQDRFAHRGFTSRLGHYRLYHLPDFISSDREKAEEMASQTAKKLSLFMTQAGIGVPKEVGDDVIEEAIDRFFRVNFYLGVNINTLYPNWRDWDPTHMKLPIPGYRPTPFQDGPDVRAARLEVEAMLNEKQPGDFVLLYDLKGDGTFESDKSIGFLRENEIKSKRNGAIIYELKSERTNAAQIPIQIY